MGGFPNRREYDSVRPEASRTRSCRSASRSRSAEPSFPPALSARLRRAHAMAEHLKEIGAQVASGAHAVVVCNGAGWHQPGERLRVPDNITLLPFPPYSPELNPMENIWDYLRGNKLSRWVWANYEAILAACKDAWLFLIGDPDLVDTAAHRASTSINL
ncbi:MAG: transposase [Terracidiphilus sp.]